MTPERVKSFVMADVSDEALELGDTLDKPTLHVTIVPPFRHPRIATGLIIRTLGHQLRQVRSFDVRALDDEIRAFNGTEHVAARKVGSYMLHAVHNLLIPAVQKLGIDIDTTYALDAYSPHSSYKGDEGLEAGDSRTVDALYLMQKTALSRGEPTWYVAAKYDLEQES